MCSYRRLAYERNPFIIPMVIIIVGIMSARIMSMVITNPIKKRSKAPSIFNKALGILE